MDPWPTGEGEGEKRKKEEGAFSSPSSWLSLPSSHRKTSAGPWQAVRMSWEDDKGGKERVLFHSHHQWEAPLSTLHTVFDGNVAKVIHYKGITKKSDQIKH